VPDARPRDFLQDFARRARDLPRLRRLDRVALQVLDAFAAADVDALLLKGPVLARILYMADEHRAYSDVDLLVSPFDRQAAGRALTGLGYTNVPEGLGIENVAGAVPAETWAGHGESEGVVIDLHSQMPSSKAHPEAAWESLSRRRTSIELAGRRVPTLDNEGLAMHLAIHVAQHGTGYRKPVEDLERGLERWPLEVWRRAASLAGELGATEAFAAGLRLVPRGAALAQDLRLPATDELLWTIAHRDSRPRGTFHLEALRDARSPRARASVLRRALIPKREWIAWQYPWASRGRVHLAVAYGRHLARTPIWAARAWRFRRRARRAS
jgi:hypothetical protein